MGGINGNKDYDSEQILSTLLLRAYLSVGGGATIEDHSTWFQKRTWASRYLVYLIVSGIASLTSVQTTPTPTAEDYATAMMLADSGILGFDRTPEGAASKVIRWAFEKQGAFLILRIL